MHAARGRAGQLVKDLKIEERTKVHRWNHRGIISLMTPSKKTNSHYQLLLRPPSPTPSHNLDMHLWCGVGWLVPLCGTFFPTGMRVSGACRITWWHDSLITWSNMRRDPENHVDFRVRLSLVFYKIVDPHANSNLMNRRYGNGHQKQREVRIPA